MKSKPTKKRRKPQLSELPAPYVQEFRKCLSSALRAKDQSGRVVADAKWGVYAFYDYDGEPIYVGQTNERLRVRIQRHLTNQRTDAVAMRILDTFEVAKVEMWPLWEYEDTTPTSDKSNGGVAQNKLDQTEYCAYLWAIDKSRFKAILNEKIPPKRPKAKLPKSFSYPLISTTVREERGHPDVRIARRAETIARLAAVAHERGEVSPGLRRVLVIQAVRLTYLAAVRLAEAEGRTAPAASIIPVTALVGTVLAEADEGDSEGGEKHAGEAELES
jgi:hypothetical protein